MSKDKQLDNDAEIEAVASETEVSSDSSSTEASNRRAFMTGALAATAGVVAASALGSRKAEAKPMATSMSMAAGSANFSFTYTTTEWGIQDVSSSNWYVHGSQGAETSLYFNGLEKFKTTSEGISIGSGSGGSAHYNADNLIIDSDGSTGLSILGGTSNASTIFFGDSTDNNLARIQVLLSSAGNTMNLAAGGNTGTLVLDTNDNATFAGSLYLGDTGGNYQIRNKVDNGVSVLNGGSITSNGANILLYGSTHATNAFDIKIRQGGTDKLFHDYSTNMWTMYGNMTLERHIPILQLKSTDTSMSDGVAIGAMEFYGSDSSRPGVSAKIAAVGEGTAGTTLLKFYSYRSDNLVESLSLRGSAATFSGTVTATDFTATSDRSLKNNFQNIENPLKRLLNLNGYIHSWKAGGEDSFGFIHDEVEASEPLLAIRNDEGLGSVNYQKVVPLIVEAARELRAENDELKNRLERLENMINKIIQGEA